MPIFKERTLADMAEAAFLIKKDARWGSCWRSRRSSYLLSWIDRSGLVEGLVAAAAVAAAMLVRDTIFPEDQSRY
jgi:hypothetical protein